MFVFVSCCGYVPLVTLPIVVATGAGVRPKPIADGEVGRFCFVNVLGNWFLLSWLINRCPGCRADLGCIQKNDCDVAFAPMALNKVGGAALRLSFFA